MSNRFHLSLLLVLSSCAVGETGTDRVGRATDSPRADDATPASSPVDLAVTESGAVTFGGASGPALVERDGAGPFFAQIRHLDPGTNGERTTSHASSTWTCASKTTSSAGPALVTIFWSECSVPEALGTFDVIVAFAAQPDGAVDLELWAASRLEHAALDALRFVMRIGRESWPADETAARVLFGYDEWIRDPLQALSRERAHLENVHVQQAAVLDEGDGTILYHNRLKTTSMLSVHTPGWGLVLHSMDPHNADPGWLVVGSNPNAEGVRHLDFGMTQRVEGSYAPANGRAGEPFRVGPRMRARLLPAARPLADAWWEAALAYRPWLEAEGPVPERLVESAYPATWARECLYAAWIMTTVPDYDGTDPVSPIEVAPVVARARQVAEFYREGEGGDGPIDICPLLWGTHTYAPHVMRPNTRELVAALHALGSELDVRFHPLMYVDTACVDLSRASEELADAAIRNLDGSLYWSGCAHGEGALARYDHPVLQGDLLRAVGEAYAAGFRGAYHDAPFGEWGTDPSRLFGPSPVIHRGVQSSIDMMADELTRLGGGVVGIEQARLGHRAIQAGESALPFAMYLESDAVPFSSALWHERSIGGYFGDILLASEGLRAADASFDPLVRLSCPDAEGGLADNVRHVPRLAMEGVVYGRLALDPEGRYWQYESSTDPWQQRLAEYARLVREGMHLRRRVPALRTGVMLPTPPSSSGSLLVGGRGFHETGTPPRLVADCRISRRMVPEHPAALYQDLERPGHFVLVVANPGTTESAVDFAIDAAAYPEMTASSYDALLDGALLDAGRELRVRVPVAARGYAVVEIAPISSPAP